MQVVQFDYFFIFPDVHERPEKNFWAWRKEEDKKEEEKMKEFQR